MSAGAAAAGTGGALAIAASLLLPFHGAGDRVAGMQLGGWIAGGFLAAGLLLAVASMALAARHPRDRVGRALRSWAVLGAAGFAVSGFGLVGDVVERPIVTSEVAAVGAVLAWWIAVWRRLREHEAPRFATFSLICAILAVGALVLQFTWDALPAGAIPVRFVYVLWGPWGVSLARVLRSSREVS